jgi:nitroreductase
LEFAEVLRRRRMVRTYTDRPVDRELVDRVVDAGRRAPSAGFSQGWAFVVLEGAEQTQPFWALTAPASPRRTAGDRWDRIRAAPVIIVALAHPQAYLDRYQESDKAGLGLEREAGWRVPFWLIDTAFAAMTILLAATDAGLGSLFFALGGGEAELLAHLGVPSGYEPIGAIALGWPSEHDVRSPSLARGRRDRAETVHYGRWAEPRGRPPPGQAANWDR